MQGRCWVSHATWTSCCRRAPDSGMVQQVVGGGLCPECRHRGGRPPAGALPGARVQSAAASLQALYPVPEAPAIIAAAACRTCEAYRTRAYMRSAIKFSFAPQPVHGPVAGSVRPPYGPRCSARRCAMIRRYRRGHRVQWPRATTTSSCHCPLSRTSWGFLVNCSRDDRRIAHARNA